MDGEQGAPETGLANLAEAFLLLLLFLLAAALTLLPITRTISLIWFSDPLRSFGLLLPFVSIALMARVWRTIGWQRDGTAWGTLPVLTAVTLALASSGFGISYTAHGLTIDPLQPGAILSTFFSGVLLLLGGKVLWRQSLFPLALLLLVNPVPHVFSTWIDMPLQVASASVARSFAHGLGLYPTGQQLQLMFTPKFGMQIIPGCNGMRGAATMAYVALLIAWLRGYRPLRIAIIVAGAALLGYLLNFLRLCLLVFYYWIGSNHPALRGDGVLIDYIIGGAIFLTVSTLTGWLWLGGHGDTSALPAERPVDWPSLLRRPAIAGTAAVLALIALFQVPAAWSAVRAQPALTPSTALAELPANLGPWQRTGTSQEIADGVIRWLWMSYSNPAGRRVDVGIWLPRYQHFALGSRRVQGIHPSTLEQFDAVALGGRPVHLSAFTIQDDLADGPPIPTFSAETICLPRRCSGTLSGFQAEGLTYAMGPVATRSEPRLSMIFRVQHQPGSQLTNVARLQDAEDVKDVLRFLDTGKLARNLGTR